jgi:trigger factor
MDELKEDIRKQIVFEKQNRADREYEAKLLDKIVDDAKAAIPDALISSEVERLERDERQDLMYRGQTWQEHLKEEGVNEEEHRDKKRPEAERRVKAGLVLAEIAEAEKIDVTADELDDRIAALKSQYQDKQMLSEINKPENRREIASRLLTEKTIQTLVNYASAK